MSEQEQTSWLDEGRYAAIALARLDHKHLEQYEAWTKTLTKEQFEDWVGKFSMEPARLRHAPPAEVAALVRRLEEWPGWVSPERYQRVQTHLSEQLPQADLAVVRDVRALAVDEVRQAQDPERARLRAELLEAVDATFAVMERSGQPVRTALARVLADRGLVTLDAELGEPVGPVVERVDRAPARPGAARQELRPPSLAALRPGMGLDR